MDWVVAELSDLLDNDEELFARILEDSGVQTQDSLAQRQNSEILGSIDQCSQNYNETLEFPQASNSDDIASSVPSQSSTNSFQNDEDLELIEEILFGEVSNHHSESPNESDAIRTRSSVCLSSSDESELTRSTSPNGQRICAVCSAPASNHNHYGATVCSSCRGFFRRTVSNGSADILICKANKNCPIDSKSRKSCGWCRYQLCLKAGMNPKWLMTAKEKQQRQNKKRQLLTKRKVLSSSPSPKSFHLPMCLTSEETLFIESLTQNMVNNVLSFMAERLSNNTVPILAFRNNVILGRPNPPSVIRNFEASRKVLFMTCFSSLNDIKNVVDQCDLKMLIEANFPVFHTMDFAIKTNGKDFMYQMHYLFQNLTRQISSQEVNDVLCKLFEEIQVTARQKNDEVSLNLDLIHFASSRNNLSQEVKRNLDTIRKWPRLSPNKQYDPNMIILFMLSTVLSPNGLYFSLKNPKIVEELQQKYAVLLYRYLQSKFGSHAAIKYGHAMSLASLAQKTYNLHVKLLPPVN